MADGGGRASAERFSDVLRNLLLTVVAFFRSLSSKVRRIIPPAVESSHATITRREVLKGRILDAFHVEASEPGSDGGSMSGSEDSRLSRFIGSARGLLSEIWRSRSILWSLVRKDLVGRYRNSVFGFAWHFAMPLAMLCVYYIAFSTIRVAPIDDFPIYLASGIFLFTFMTSNLAGGAGTITGNAGMVKKMYFPREILVFSHVLTTAFVMVVGYIIVFAAVIATGFHLDPVSVLLLPLVLILAMVFVTGYVLLFSALNVYFRDVQYLLQSISMVFFMLTPMYFLADTATGLLGTIIWYNPFTYFVEAAHDCIYFGEVPSLHIIGMCAAIALASLALGTAVFERLKNGFAERL